MSPFLTAFQALAPSTEWQVVPVPVGPTALPKHRARLLREYGAQVRIAGPAGFEHPDKVLLEVRLVNEPWDRAVLRTLVQAGVPDRWTEVPVAIGRTTWYQRGYRTLLYRNNVLTRVARSANAEEVRALHRPRGGADYVICEARAKGGKIILDTDLAP